MQQDFAKIVQQMSTNAMAPNLYFRMTSCYCAFDGSPNLTGETNLFVKGFTYLVGLFLVPNALSLLDNHVTTREAQFAPHSCGEKKIYAVSSQKDFLSKSVKIFHHSFAIVHNQGHTLVQMLFLA